MNLTALGTYLGMYGSATIVSATIAMFSQRDRG
jgi:hypothetical protein